MKTFKALLYAERDVFPFYFVRMSHLDNNIPSNIYYASIRSENIRFARTTFDINSFLTLSNRLLKRMQKTRK